MIFVKYKKKYLLSVDTAIFIAGLLVVILCPSADLKALSYSGYSDSLGTTHIYSSDPFAPSYTSYTDQLGFTKTFSSNVFAPSYSSYTDRFGTTKTFSSNPFAPSYTSNVDRLGSFTIFSSDIFAPSYTGSTDRFGFTSIRGSNGSSYTISTDSLGGFQVSGSGGSLPKTKTYTPSTVSLPVSITTNTVPRLPTVSQSNTNSGGSGKITTLSPQKNSGIGGSLSPTPNPSQPIIPPSIFIPAPAPAPKPEPVRTTISNIKAEEYGGGIVISWDSNKSTSGWLALIGKQSDLSDASELKPLYKSARYSPYEENTTYYYQITVKDTCTTCLSYDPEEAKSQIFSITTKERTQKVIDTKVSIIDSRTAEITIEGNLPTWATFEFRRESESRFMGCSIIPDSTSCEETLGKNISSKIHKYLLTNLSRADKHYYRVSLWGGSGTGETIVSDIYSFNTPVE